MEQLLRLQLMVPALLATFSAVVYALMYQNYLISAMTQQSLNHYEHD